MPFEDQLIFDDVPVKNVALSAHLPVDNAVSFELATLYGLMERAVTDHDAKLWSQFYADDGIFLYSRSPAYSGRKQLDGFMEFRYRTLYVRLTDMVTLFQTYIQILDRVSLCQ